MLKIFNFFLAILLIANHVLIAQPIANFSLDPSSCRNQSLDIENLSQELTNFKWDFCHNDLLVNPVATQPISLSTTGTIFYSAIRIIQDEGKWYGFVTDLNGQKLWRINFGTSLSGQPESVTNLGNLQGALTSPGPIELVKENGIWYGFIANVFGNNLARLKFNNGIAQLPDVEQNLITGSTPIGIKIVDSGVDKKLIVSFLSSARISVYDFGTTFNGSIVQTNHVNNSNFGWGVDVIKEDLNWIALIVAGNGNKVYKVDYGISLLNNNPQITEIATVSAANEIKVIKEGQNFVSFIRSSNNGISRANLGAAIGNTANYIKITSNELQNNSRSLEVVREFPGYALYTVEALEGKIFKLGFEGNCSGDVSSNTLLQTSPSGVKYFSQGNYWIEMFGEDIDNNVYVKGQSVSISSFNAPEVLIDVSSNVCLGNSNTFSFNANKPLINTNWNFGDGNLSTQPTPTHEFVNTGVFNVILKVTDSEGCKNTINKTHTIFNPPSASFTLPTGLICTNNEFTFTNNTVDNFDGNLTFQWLLDDVPVSTDEDLLYTFNSGGDKEITLQASIPGCSSESVQIVTGVGEGPTVDFTIAGNCLNESTLLANNSQGAIAGYSWDFGDGQTSTDLNPTVNYTAAGNYTVELETLGTNGCISKKSIPHQIFSIPQPNFNIDLPPFSCNGTPTQFNDLTPSLTDSNLNTWQWNFNNQNASASIQHPQYTYALSGDYNVSLTVTSDQGCVAAVNKTITIAQAPQPVIVNTPACIETAVVLQDGAATSASAWQWQVGNNFYFTKSPSHVFATPGNYEISLTLTALNGCVGTTTKQVAVPLPLTVNFESAFNCANTATQFTAVINDVADPVTNHTWLFGDDMRSGATVNYLYDAPGTEEVQLIATTQNGCAYTITKAITILPAPVADFSFTPSSGAPPLAVTFTNQSVNANSFMWNFNDAANTTSSLQSPAFTFTDFGEYAVDLTARNSAGCESTVSKLIAVALPRINVTLDNFRIIRNTDGSFLLLTNILNNGNVLVQNPKIEIRLDNAATLQEVLNTNIVAGASVDYTLSTLVGANNNLNYACIRLVLPNNEAQENTEACITFESNTAITSPYPNPANEQVTVEWISPTDESVSVMVNDYLGNLMATETISSQQGLNTLKLQTLDWQAGIYFIRIKSNSREHFFRTIIAR